MKSHLLPIICMSLAASFGNNPPVSAQKVDTILTDNVVELRETISPQGFVHPGISCNAETLSVMREKVIAGVSPWVDYFEGLRRTPWANVDQRPRFVEQITNDGGIGAYAFDAHLLWTHTILYIVSGNEAYRKRPVEIIKWYGGRTDKSFFPNYFADSHIKIGKYVYTMCSAVDILRTIEPKDPSLAVTQEMVTALNTNCIGPIRKNSIQFNNYFMNQHTYAIMGYLASTILGDEVEDYKQAVEWTTVNATTLNQGRNGSIKQQIRMVTRNDKTGETVEPNLQLVEMGRDQAHASGNIDNLLMMSKTIDFQKTKVDPVAGAVTKNADGVSPIHFLDDRLPKGEALYAKYNLGYGLKWIPTYTETDPKHGDYLARYDQLSWRGGVGGSGTANAYYYFKAMGFDMDAPPCRYIKAAFNATAVGREYSMRSGSYINAIHNYAFDFWIGLPASSSDSAPDPGKAKRALAVVLPPMEVTRDGVPVKGAQFEYSYVDLSAHAIPGDIYPGSPKDIPLKVQADADGTRYVRMTLEKDPRTMVLLAGFPAGAGLRVRSDGVVKINFQKQETYFPNTNGQWKYVTTDAGSGGGVHYIEATPMEGPATIDFDRIDTEPDQVLPLSFDVAEDAKLFPTYVGANVEKDYPATYSDKQSDGKTPVERKNDKIEYTTRNLPTGAALDSTSGKFTWTPSADQAGDHTIYITAQTAVSLRTQRIDVHVAKDLQEALDNLAKVYNPKEKYESASLEAFKAALQTKDLATVRKAAKQLALLTPKLADGTLDYTKTWSSTILGSDKMADSDELTWGGLWGFDKNVTMDFGKNFKVKSRAFGLQCRVGFPIRVSEAVVYGSNNGFDWTLLTENAAKSSPDFQKLTVKKSLQETSYRFLRFFMPAKPFPIFEIAELRIYGERVVDYSPDYHKAYIKGYSDGTFRPDQKLTRAEAASALANAMDDYTDKGAYSCEYSDVDRNAWYFDDLAYMTEKRLIGAADGKVFAPNSSITRGELAGIMTRMNKQATPGRLVVNVPSTAPTADEINYVTAKGWLTPDSDGEFHPNDPVTRAQFVIAVNKMLGRNDAGGKSASTFKDVGRSYWAHDAITEAAQTHAVE